MSESAFPGIGHTYKIDAGARVFHDRYDADGTMTFDVVSGAGAPRTETVAVTVEHVVDNIWNSAWQEESGQTVVHVNDFDNDKAYVYVTTAEGKFVNFTVKMTRLD